MTRGSGLEATMPVGILLRQALQKPDYQIVGAPGWIDTERYSIRARAPEGTPAPAVMVMLANLLRDRFQLATHLETRELPIFHLVMARSDGRLGPDFKTTPTECQATMAERQAAARRDGPPPPIPASLFDPKARLCGFTRVDAGVAIGSGSTVAQISSTLSDLVGRTVIDKTGLTGLYDFTLKIRSRAWTLCRPYRTTSGCASAGHRPQCLQPCRRTAGTARAQARWRPWSG